MHNQTTRAEEYVQKGVVEGMTPYADKAAAAAADAMVHRFDGWLARQRQFYCDDPDLPPIFASPMKWLFDVAAAEERNLFENMVEEELKLRTRRMSEVDKNASAAFHLKRLEARGGLVGKLVRFRAALLYALLPYDRTSWNRLKDPQHLMVKGACACPYGGVGALAYARPGGRLVRRSRSSGRGAAAAPTWIFRGDAAAPPRLRR